MYCAHCGKPLDERSRFCPACGSPVVNDGATEVAPATQNEGKPAERATSKTAGKPLALALVAGAAVGILAAVLLRSVLGGGGPVAKPAGEGADVTQSGATEPEEPEAAPAKPRQSLEEQAATAYGIILDDASSYFADPWYDQLPDSDVTYTLMELTGDTVPELLLEAHYSNVGSHGSGGMRMIPFVYDAAVDSAYPATNSEFSLFAEPWVWVSYDPGHHELNVEARYTNGMDSTFYRVWIEGPELLREEVDKSEVPGDDFPYDSYDVGDRSLIEQVLGVAGAGSQGAGPSAGADYENEYFSVDVPESWGDDWSVEESDKYAWTFRRGDGVADIRFGNGLLEGYEILGSVGEGMDAIGVSMRQTGSGFFGDGMATITLK